MYQSIKKNRNPQSNETFVKIRFSEKRLIENPESLTLDDTEC